MMNGKSGLNQNFKLLETNIYIFVELEIVLTCQKKMLVNLITVSEQMMVGVSVLTVG